MTEIRRDSNGHERRAAVVDERSYDERQLAGGYAACLDTERDGQRTTLISLLDGPGAPDPASPQHS